MHSTAIDPILSKPNAKDKTNLDRVNLEEELWDIDEETNFFIKDEIIRCTEHACGRFKLPVYVTDDWVVRRWYLHCQGFTHVRAREARRRSEVPDELEMKIAVHTTKSSGMDVRQKVEGEDEAVEDEDVNVESRKPSSPEKIGLVGEDVISHGHFIDDHIPQSTLCSTSASKACPTSASTEDGKHFMGNMLDKSSQSDFVAVDLIATSTVGQETLAIGMTHSAIGSYGFTVADPIVVETWRDRPYGTREKPIVLLDNVLLGNEAI